MQRYLLLLLLMQPFIFTSCDLLNKGGEEDQPDKTIAKIHIEDATSLLVARTSTYEAKLYGVKETDDGKQVFEVAYSNANGDTITPATAPAYIFNLNNFVILSFGSEYDFNESYLISKTSGAAYSIPREQQPHTVGNKYSYSLMFPNGKDKIQEVGSNMYYCTYQQSSPHKKTLYKVSLATPSALEFNEVSAASDDVLGFCVDKDGNILYGHYNSDYSSGDNLRYRKSRDGSFVKIPALTSIKHDENNYTHTRLMAFWKGVDGDIYGVKVISNTLTSPEQYLIKIDADSIKQLRKVSVDLGNPMCDNCGFGTLFHVQNQIMCYSNGKLFNLSSEEQYNEVECSLTPSVTFNNNLYHFNQEQLSCNAINIETGETSLLYDLDESKLGNYDVDKIIEVTQDGVTFSAIDLRNGKYIVAKIGLDNIVTEQLSIVGSVAVTVPL